MIVAATCKVMTDLLLRGAIKRFYGMTNIEANEFDTAWRGYEEAVRDLLANFIKVNDINSRLPRGRNCLFL